MVRTGIEGMKTTHQIARELLELPDVPLQIEMWCRMEGHETAVDFREEDETAIIWQKPITLGNSTERE